jgi:hypothetical protein
VGSNLASVIPALPLPRGLQSMYFLRVSQLGQYSSVALVCDGILLQPQAACLYLSRQTATECLATNVRDVKAIGDQRESLPTGG